MQFDINFDQRTVNALRQAIANNPKSVLSATRTFLSRGMAKYKEGIIRSPWRIGGIGGGAPVDTGSLRDTHRTEFSSFEARIFPSARYALFVHEGTKYLPARPWLDFVKQQKESQIHQLESQLLDSIVKDFTK